MAEAPRAAPWPALPYGSWVETLDTVHAHAQVLGKLAAGLAPPEPELQHAALRLTPRGIETAPLPAPDGSGAVVVALDLRTHHALVEHNDGRSRAVALMPGRSVGAVTREVLGCVAELVGRVAISMQPQEVTWSDPLDSDERHHTYEPEHVVAYHAAATRAALVLSALRAPYRGRSTPVNAWWGGFDLSVSLYSGRPADPATDSFLDRNSADAQHVEVGWWPGDARHPSTAFYGYVSPAQDGFAGVLQPPLGRWDAALGEYLLEWDDVIASADPFAAALAFGQAVVGLACAVCAWDPTLAASARGEVPAVR